MRGFSHRGAGSERVSSPLSGPFLLRSASVVRQGREFVSPGLCLSRSVAGCGKVLRTTDGLQRPENSWEAGFRPYTFWLNEFYQKGCQEKSSASTGVERFSRDPAHGN